MGREAQVVLGGEVNALAERALVVAHGAGGRRTLFQRSRKRPYVALAARVLPVEEVLHRAQEDRRSVGTLKSRMLDFRAYSGTPSIVACRVIFLLPPVGLFRRTLTAGGKQAVNLGEPRESAFQQG